MRRDESYRVFKGGGHIWHWGGCGGREIEGFGVWYLCMVIAVN